MKNKCNLNIFKYFTLSPSLLFVIAVLPIAQKVSAAVPVPLITQYEFYLLSVCKEYPSCCPLIINSYPMCKITGGISTKPEDSCGRLLTAYNEYNQCAWNAIGNTGDYPHLYDDFLTSSSGASCELIMHNLNGTTTNLLTYGGGIGSFCLSSAYEPSGSECILSGINPYKNNGVCPTVGNPIHTALGYKLQKETDYPVSSTSTLKFKRYYGSGDHWGQSELGINWLHTYSRQIQLNSTPTISTVTVYRPNGDRFYFTLQGDDAWVSDEDVSTRLVRLHDTDEQLTGWEYTDNNDNVERYDANGKLTTITNRMDQVLSFSYDVNERISSISDTFGHSISFTYDTNSRISMMTDPTGGKHEYSYSTNNNLIQVTRPDQTTRQYHYENSDFPHALTGITDENGNRYATWSYDEEGRAISSEHANSVDKTTLTYNADGTTTVTNPLGKQTTYHFTTIHGVRKVIQVEGHPTASCEGANKSYIYDANGNIASKTDWNGVVTNYTYDMDRNLELTRTEAAGTPQERTITTEWHPQFRLPTKTTQPGKITEYTYDAKGRRLSSKVSSVQ